MLTFDYFRNFLAFFVIIIDFKLEKFGGFIWKSYVKLI